MRLFTGVLAGMLMIPGLASAQTGYTIAGGLSNFDCHNRTDEPCDEFEIEIEGIRPEDVVHTYTNGNYGSPRVLLSSDGTFTIIDYHNPQHLTAVNTLEHFGVSLRQLNVANAIRVRWMRNGHVATVNGRPPLPGGGAAPATQPVMPTISADLVPTAAWEGVSCTVTNNDTTQGMWIRRRAMVSQGSVTLEALMSNNPVVTTTVPIDPAPVFLSPGMSMTTVTDLIEIEENQNVVFAAEYSQDLLTPGPFNQTHYAGPVLGNVMTATLAGPGASCAENMPIIQDQPISVSALEGHSANLRVRADGNNLSLTYQWIRDGAPVVEGGLFHGTTTDELSIDEVNAATEGFYAVRVSNACGTAVSDSALVFITGHNYVPAPLGATADPGTLAATVGDVVTLNGTGAFIPAGSTYQWKRNGVDIQNGAGGASAGGGIVSGAAGPADVTGMPLMIDGVQPGDAGDYTLVITNPSGSATSNAAALSVVPAAPVACSPADVATEGNGDPLAGPDGFVTGVDFDVYVISYFKELARPDGSLLADLTDGSGTGGPDGFITGTDFDLFVQLYFMGC